MESQSKQTKKFWKPPSFEDFNLSTPPKKIKLDSEDFSQEQSPDISNEEFEPKSIEELSIHPKKIEEVRNWLKYSCKEPSAMLLVTGPPGSGKTTTVKVVASSEGFSIKEWINPVDKMDFKPEPIVECDGYDRFLFSETKQTEKFEDFVLRSSRYTSLFDKSNKTVIIIEDIPNIFLWKPKLFHEFLERYKINGKSPIVFIVTDDQSLNLQNSLFPNHIKNKCSICSIKFNPVNNSALVKNLKNLSHLYCTEKISSQFLERITKNCNGDLRSASSDLLMFLRSSTVASGQIPKKPKKKIKKNEGLGADSKPITVKDVTCDFYHVIGRILYPKLMPTNDKLECGNPQRILLHDVLKISEQWSSSFLSILHENYLQTFGKFSDIVKASNCFSFCDVLGKYVELEQYTSLIGVTDLMLTNKEPKKCGFNPIKSGFVITKKLGEGLIMEGLGEKLMGREVLLDLVPFLKILRVNDIESVLDHVKSNVEPNDELIEIEEFDD